MQLAIDLLTLLATLIGVTISLLVYLRDRPDRLPIANVDLQPVAQNSEWMLMTITIQNITEQVWTLRSIRLLAPKHAKLASSSEALKLDGVGGRRFSQEAALIAAARSVSIEQRIAPVGMEGISFMANTGDRVRVTVYLFASSHLKRPFRIRVALDLVDNAIRIKKRTIKFTRLVTSVASRTSSDTNS